MEHRGVEYRIIQGIKRGFWKWSVETETGKNFGTSDSRDAAMAARQRISRIALQGRHAVQIGPGLQPKSPENGSFSNVCRRLPAPSSLQSPKTKPPAPS